MTASGAHQSPSQAGSERMSPLATARRGLFGRCPACGEGRIFRAFLKVADNCPACGEELHHHRADDFPAYVVIVLVGHIVVPLVLIAETNFAPSYFFHMTVWPALTLGLGLAFLQPVKGAIVALQWALGMHGFEESKIRREAVARTR
ncbi:MAG: DUF983 domain-containing protein [Alphaproteobacteria bacterium]|nr:DUF983 domain-containing protein [Alphaproteobacteria bacterium]